jgi:hypothetical protein
MKIGQEERRRPARRSATELSLDCVAFNRENPVGTQVSVRLDSGTVLETVTTSEAWVMGGHSVVVLVKGINGAYALERVSKGWAAPSGAANGGKAEVES